MVTAAINFFIYTTIFFVIGMIKPNWALFFMKKADRFMVLIISIVLFMVAATLFGEGTREEKAAESTSSKTLDDSVPVVKPVPDKISPVVEKLPEPEVKPEVPPKKEAN